MNFLIVGSNADTGREIIHQLLEGNHHVYGISRSMTEIDDPRYHHKVFDILGDEEWPGDFLPESLDGMAYLPGSIFLKPFRVIKEAQFLEDYRVNLLGAVRSIRQIQKSLNEGSGIVLFSTVAVQTGMPYHASIASAKGAVEGLSRSLAAEFSPRIRVNCIAPSLTDTKLAERLLNTPERRHASAERHPLKKIGSTKDIASMACFLLGNESGWITGQVIQVDGGLSSIK